MDIQSSKCFIQGRIHKLNNLPCQDRVAVYRYNNIIAMSLADGAGSCKYSDIGAEIVTSEINKLLTKKFDIFFKSDGDNIRQQIIETLHDKLKVEAQKRQIQLKELSSTLLFVAIKANNFLSGHIGDGLIGVQIKKADMEKEDIIVLSYPERGEYANETYFTTGVDVMKHLRLYRGNIDDKSGFVMMSDGAMDCLFNKKENRFALAIERFFEWMENHSEEVINKALEENFSKLIIEKTTDDCSIGLLKIRKEGKKNELRRTELSTEQLKNLPFEELNDLPAYQLKYHLKCKNKRALHNKLKVLKAIRIYGKEYKKHLKLKHKTIENHKKSLKESGWITF
ncbi:hypothetical protein MHK_010685 [Candidatus Magnetomorum sp. HK-1]|nr:hypothetical protein MHK_010685 [Candidatus Magnetomorum sp. HK-1]